MARMQLSHKLDRKQHSTKKGDMMRQSNNYKKQAMYEAGIQRLTPINIGIM